MTRYKAGDWIQLCEMQYGTAQGPVGRAERRSALEVPAGSVREVFAVHPSTGWLTVHFDLDDAGVREPYRVEVIVDVAKAPPYQGWGGTMPDLPADG